MEVADTAHKLEIANCGKYFQVTRMALTLEEEKAEGEHMEAIIGKKLVHPNIVRTLASGFRKMASNDNYDQVIEKTLYSHL